MLSSSPSPCPFPQPQPPPQPPPAAPPALKSFSSFFSSALLSATDPTPQHLLFCLFGPLLPSFPLTDPILQGGSAPPQGSYWTQIQAKL